VIAESIEKVTSRSKAQSHPIMTEGLSFIVRVGVGCGSLLLNVLRVENVKSQNELQDIDQNHWAAPEIDFRSPHAATADLLAKKHDDFHEYCVTAQISNAQSSDLHHMHGDVISFMPLRGMRAVIRETMIDRPK
jgi:hypothetical protein